MKTYKIKNYKGNLIESLKKFSDSHKDMKIVEAIEEDSSLKIKAESIIVKEDDQEVATDDSKFNEAFFKEIKAKAEDKLSIFSEWEPKFQHEISAKERKDILMEIRMAIYLLDDAAPYPKSGEQTKRKVASKINSLHDKLIDLSNQVHELTR